MERYTTTKAGYDKLKQALDLASRDRKPEIIVEDLVVQGAVGVISPVYHVGNASVMVAPECEGMGFEISANSTFAKREAVSALEHLPWLYELSDRKIRLRRIK